MRFLKGRFLPFRMSKQVVLSNSASHTLLQVIHWFACVHEFHRYITHAGLYSKLDLYLSLHNLRSIVF
jgi:hypothetical protein